MNIDDLEEAIKLADRLFGNTSPELKGLKQRTFTDMESIRKAGINLVCHTCAEKEGLEIFLDEKSEWLTRNGISFEEYALVCPNCKNRIVIDTGFI